MEFEAIAKRAAALHNGSSPKFKATLAPLRKVADRAYAEWQASRFPGTSPEPVVRARVEKFVTALAGSGSTEDTDLLPAKHPARTQAADPWAQLIGAEARLASLAKGLVSAVSRADVRKSETAALGELHQKLNHLYQVNFGSSVVAKAASGLERSELIKAAAIVQEELERRGVDVARDQPLYSEALALRASPVLTKSAGTLLQSSAAVYLRLEEGTLALPVRSVAQDVTKAAGMWSPDGTRYHVAFREPVESTYLAAADVPSDAVEIGKFEYTTGAQAEEFAELFVSGVLSGVLVVGKESLVLRKSLVPYVLTPAAVAAGWMPPEGESALPASLELDVPPELRFWKAAVGEDARTIRDHLVASDLFAEGSVALINGHLHRLVTKVFKAAPFPASPAEFTHAQPAPEPFEQAAALCGPTSLAQGLAAGEAVLKGDSAEGDLFLFEAGAVPGICVQSLGARDRYLVGAPDSAENRSALAHLGRVFKFSGPDGHIFVSSHAVGENVSWLDVEQPQVSLVQEPEQVAKVRLLKTAEQAAELRYVLGVVLEPETVDSQSDIYSAEEIRKSAHTFLAKYRNAGLQHAALINEHVHIVESYLAPVDMEVAGAVVKQGTWLMGMVIENDDLWAAVKDGTLTGFSIGGSGVRTPVEDSAE